MGRRVSVLILYNDRKEVLLQHRSEDAERSPNYWAFFGGGIEEGETPDEALVRELFEELEYKVKSPKLAFKDESKLVEEEPAYIYIEKYDVSQPLVQHEGQGMAWKRIEDTHDLLMSERGRRILQTIEPYLNKHE